MRIMLAMLAVLLSALIEGPPARAQNVDPQCAPALARYNAAPGPKAFAAGTTRGCGWQTRSDQFATLQAIQAQALRQCQSAGGDACRIVASLATGNAGQLNTQGRTPQCEQAFGRYRSAAGEKAFAQGVNGGCGWQIANSQFRTTAEIEARAIAQCKQNGGQNCRVVARAP